MMGATFLSHTGDDHEVPVLISGGGPVGLTLALILAQHGVRSIILERRVPRSGSAPKAHVVNPRSLEVYRSLGVNLERLRKRDHKDDVSRFVTKLNGEEFGRIPLSVPECEAFIMTPTPLMNIAQPDLEAVLTERVNDEALIDLRVAHNWVSCRTVDGGVVSTIENASGSYEISSNYLVAADGANSSVRQFLGIEMKGTPIVRPRVTIHFEANLRHLVCDRLAVLYWILDPAVAGTFIAYDVDKTWVYTPRVAPEHFNKSEYTDEYCTKLVKDAIGDHTVDIQIKNVVPWMMAAEVAITFRHGPVLLVGDAAHRFPPTGGLGLNTGVQDAHNLAWKLAAVLRNASDSSLLDSYDAERRPVAEINTRQSLHNSARLPGLFQMAAEAIIDGQVVEGGAQRLAAEIPTHREHFLSPGLQMGFSYGPPVRGPDDPTRFMPSARVGDRMPHGWVRHGGSRLSTLDLLDPTAFTLFLGAEKSNWRSVIASFSVVSVVVLGSDYFFEADWRDLCGMSAKSAMLVRPDGHIAATFVDDSEPSRLQLISVLEACGGGGAVPRNGGQLDFRYCRFSDTIFSGRDQ